MPEKEPPKVGIAVLPFGAILSTDENNMIVADAGDIKLSLEDDGEESYITMNPDTAEAIAENLLVAVAQARKLIDNHNGEVS